MRVILGLLLLLLFYQPAHSADCSINLDIFAYSGSYAALQGGYCVDGYWTPGLITDETYRERPPMHTVTRALYQRKGLIEQTAEIRKLTMDGVEGYISLLSPTVLGWTVWIRPLGEREWVATRNVDGADRAHVYFHTVTMGSGLELSYELAERFDNINWVNPDGTRYRQFEVCLSADAPEIECAGDPIDFTGWFLDNVEYER